MIAAHGAAATELPRGLVPVTDADFARLPEIIAAAPAATPVTTKTGRPALQYEIRLADGTIYYVEEVRAGRKVLALTTLAKKREGGAPEAGSRPGGGPAPPTRPQRAGAPDTNISPGPEPDKTLIAELDAALSFTAARDLVIETDGGPKTASALLEEAAERSASPRKSPTPACWPERRSEIP